MVHSSIPIPTNTPSNTPESDIESKKVVKQKNFEYAFFTDVMKRSIMHLNVSASRFQL